MTHVSLVDATVRSAPSTCHWFDTVSRSVVGFCSNVLRWLLRSGSSTCAPTFRYLLQAAAFGSCVSRSIQKSPRSLLAPSLPISTLSARYRLYRSTASILFNRCRSCHDLLDCPSVGIQRAWSLFLSLMILRLFRLRYRVASYSHRVYFVLSRLDLLVPCTGVCFAPRLKRYDSISFFMIY